MAEQTLREKLIGFAQWTINKCTKLWVILTLACCCNKVCMKDAKIVTYSTVRTWCSAHVITLQPFATLKHSGYITLQDSLSE